MDNNTRLLIKEAWNFAELAYRSPQDLLSRYGGQIKIIDTGLQGIGEQAYVLNQGVRVVVAFAGSNDPVDWVRNFDFRKTDNGMYHRGFSAGLDAIGDQVMDAIGSLFAKEILVVGHSRGGGIADLFAHRFDCELPMMLTLVTFAQPRTTVKNPTQLKLSRYVRVVNGNDVVPHLPPSIFGFRNSGKLVSIGKKLSWWERIARLYMAYKIRKTTTPFMIRHHLPDAYRNSVEAL